MVVAYCLFVVWCVVLFLVALSFVGVNLLGCFVLFGLLDYACVFIVL